MQSYQHRQCPIFQRSASLFIVLKKRRLCSRRSSMQWPGPSLPLCRHESGGYYERKKISRLHSCKSQRNLIKNLDSTTTNVSDHWEGLLPSQYRINIAKFCPILVFPCCGTMSCLHHSSLVLPSLQHSVRCRYQLLFIIYWIFMNMMRRKY